MKKITEEVDDQTAIAESAGRFVEVILSIGWIKRFAEAGGDERARIRIRVAEVEYGRIVEING